jgi:5-methylcytosine-specific restriction protein A
MPHDAFYNSKPWKDARATQLRLEPHCRVCAMLGIRTPAREVDHILAIEAGGHPLNPANLRSLCRKHHSQKTIMVDGMHRDSGKALVTTGPDGFPIHVEQQRKT